jgi:hypothetical protein
MVGWIRTTAIAKVLAFDQLVHMMYFISIMQEVIHHAHVIILRIK